MCFFSSSKAEINGVFRDCSSQNSQFKVGESAKGYEKSGVRGGESRMLLEFCAFTFFTLHLISVIFFSVDFQQHGLINKESVWNYAENSATKHIRIIWWGLQIFGQSPLHGWV